MGAVQELGRSTDGEIRELIHPFKAERRKERMQTAGLK